VDLVHDPIYIRCNAGHQEQASFLYQVLPLVFYQMLLVYILFLLQPTTFIAQLNHGQSILQCPREIRNHHLQQGLVILPAIRPDLHLPIRHHLPFRILQRKQQARFLLHLFIRRINVHIRCTYQIHQLSLDRCLDGIHHIFHLFSIRRYRSRDLAGYFESIFQAIHIMGIPYLPTTVQDNHQHDQKQQSPDEHPQQIVQQISFFFQSQIPALQLLVLTGIVQDIQINITIVIRLRLHAQRRIGHTELFAETGNPFRHRHDTFGINPLQLDGLSRLGDVRLQAVQCIVTMIELFMMKVDVRKRFREVMQRLFMLAQLVIARSQGTVSTRNLIPIIVLLEKLQGTLGKSNDQLLPRQIVTVDGTHHSRTLVHKQVVILAVLQQFRHRLRGIRLKVDIPLFMAHHQAIHQVVELAYHNLLGRIGLIQASGTLHVVVIKKLRRISLQFLFHIDFANGFQGLRLLLQVIIIDRRSNGEFRAGIVETSENSIIRHGFLILRDTLHASQGTVPIIIEFLVHGGTLANLHSADIRHQALQFVGRLLVYFIQQAIRPFEIHLNEGTKGQIVQRLRLDGRIVFPHLQCLLSQLLRKVPILVSDIVCLMIQGIRLRINRVPASPPTRKERNGHP